MNSSKLEYRVWYGGQMRYDIDYIAMSGAIKLMDGTLIAPEDGAILMQFIGQREKADEKLWAGDIVSGGVFKGVIEFSHGMWGINYDYKHPDRKTMLGSWGQEHNLRRLDDGFNRECKKIGNIYENPDLIPKEEEKQKTKQ